jgi:hypothetical protein
VSIGLLHQNEDLDSRQLIERVESDGESMTLYDRERSSVVSRVGMLSETLSGGAAAMYLREIAQHELLAASEKVSLAQRIEASKAAIRALAAADTNMEDGQRVELERLVQDGEQARRRLIEGNLRLVVSVAHLEANPARTCFGDSYALFERVSSISTAEGLSVPRRVVGLVRQPAAADQHQFDPCSTERPDGWTASTSLDHLGDGWDMMTAFPPCTYLTRAGDPWYRDSPERTRAAAAASR